MSCLFNSRLFFKKSSYDIRQCICNYLQENKHIDGLNAFTLV